MPLFSLFASRPFVRGFLPRFLTVLLSVPSVQAASLTISPIGIDLPSPQRAASMTIANRGAEPVNLQLRVFRWTQVDGQDVLEPARDMLVSPPAATVAPGSSYTVRVARLDDAPVTGERSYRLFVDELPPARRQASGTAGVSILLRTSMPVFVAGGKLAPRLAWRAWMGEDGLHAEVANSGTRHVKLAGLTARPERGEPLTLGAGLNGYVLAGASRRFHFKLDAAKARELGAQWAGSTVTLSATDDNEPVEAVVHVDAR